MRQGFKVKQFIWEVITGRNVVKVKQGRERSRYKVLCEKVPLETTEPQSIAELRENM